MHSDMNKLKKCYSLKLLDISFVFTFRVFSSCCNAGTVC